MDDCLFCKMVRGEIPCEKVFENDSVLGFKDIYPQAPTHLLFIHKDHTENVNAMSGEQIAEVFSGIKEYSQKELASGGFRVVTNHGKDAGQTVFHTHFHIVGGGKLGSFGS